MESFLTSLQKNKKQYTYTKIKKYIIGVEKTFPFFPKSQKILVHVVFMGFVRGKFWGKFEEKV